MPRRAVRTNPGDRTAVVMNFSTKQHLREFGSKDETFESIILRLMEYRTSCLRDHADVPSVIRPGGENNGKR